MSTVRTVSDTKRTFYSLHTRPINALFRRVVEELMVEMHLLSVNVDFRYDPIYALGVVTSFDRFMQSYRPETDKDQIFAALCKSISADPYLYRDDAQRLVDRVLGLSDESLIAWFNQTQIPENAGDVQQKLQTILQNPQFKYSRLFAIGLYTLLEHVSPGIGKNPEKLQSLLTAAAEAFKIPFDKIQKDMELYQSNLDKMEQARAVMEDILLAERKKREQLAAAAATTETPAEAS